MDELAETPSLKIVAAAQRWCAPHLIEAIKREEKLFTAPDLVGINLPVLSDAMDLMTNQHGWTAGGRNYEPLMEAWSALQRDLKIHIEDGVCHVEGIRSGDVGDSHPTALSGLLASDMHFDFLGNTLSLRGQRYIAVRISSVPSTWAPVELGRPQGGPPQPTAPVVPTGDVRLLPYETLLDLLEEQARRVVETDGAMLFPPGRLSLVSLARGKLRQRALKGELAPTLRAEAAYLAEWVRGRVTLLQVPTPAVLAKMLGPEYAAAKARSNGAIQN
ncbi:MAG: hypothetical protein JWP30_1326 [Homoserinimonas sp.]|nr:hypothetical protein [Homoserinimonas sp.]